MAQMPYPEAIIAYKKYISLDPTGDNAGIAREFISEIENRGKPCP